MNIAPGAPFGLAIPDAKVLVLRALPGIGDLLCAEPAWRALRGALPDAELVLLGAAGVNAVVERLRVFDRVIPFVGWPGITESTTDDPRAIRDALEALQDERFDLVVQMHGSGVVTNPFAALVGGRAIAGYFLPGQWCPDPARFLAHPAHLPEIRRHLALMRFLGVDVDVDESPRFEVSDDDGREVAALAPVGDIACVHPGAAFESRRWPIDRFAAVADELAGHGLQVVVTGSAGDGPLAAELARHARSTVLDLTGRTSVGALAALIRRSRVVVTNDTGTSHLAAATKTPSVVVFTVSDPHRWAPLDRERHIVVAPPAPVPHDDHRPCRCETRCLREGCIASDAVHAGEVPPSVEEVLAAVRRQLSSSSSRSSAGSRTASTATSATNDSRWSQPTSMP